MFRVELDGSRRRLVRAPTRLAPCVHAVHPSIAQPRIYLHRALRAAQ